MKMKLTGELDRRMVVIQASEHLGFCHSRINEDIRIKF